MEKYRIIIGNLIDKKLLKPGGIYYHKLPIFIANKQTKPELQEYCMTDVIFWDLAVICHEKGIPLKLFCPECNSKLSPIPLGPRKRFMMRRLYGIHKMVWLITSLFRCCSAQKHELLGYDPRLLRCLPKLDVPFLLFHRAGTTRQLVDLILQETRQGVKIHQIQDNLAQNYLKTFNTNREEYINATTAYHLEQKADTLFYDILLYKPQCPSVTLVTQCCLTAFKEKENFYRSSMVNVKAEKFIVFDDSFQVASSLQTPKILLKKSVQFKRVMYVTNEIGQVMAWQLTKDGLYEV